MHCWFVSIFLTSTVFPVVMNDVALIFTVAVERPKRVYTHILTATIIVSTLIHVWGERLITCDTYSLTQWVVGPPLITTGQWLIMTTFLANVISAWHTKVNFKSDCC